MISLKSNHDNRDEDYAGILITWSLSKRADLAPNNAYVTNLLVVDDQPWTSQPYEQLNTLSEIHLKHYLRSNTFQVWVVIFLE